MTVEVELFDDLGAVERDARGALDREAQPSIFDRLSWFQLTEEHCAPPGDLLVLRASKGEKRAWLFLKVEGRTARALTSWYSFRFAAVEHGEAAELLSALIGALRQQRPAIARVDLSPLEAADPLISALRASGWLTFVAPVTVSSRVRTADHDFVRYWQERPARLRNTAERKAKAGKFDIAIHHRFDAAPWADYEDVYRRSWKPSEGSPAFLRALAEVEGAAGTLRLGIASKDGVPVAAQLWLVEGGVATIHKLAYAEEAKALSPGTVLTMEMFRHAIEVDRVDCIDFGVGDDPYKRDWVDERSQLFRVIAFDMRSPAGWAAAARAAASKLVGRRRKD